MTAWKVFVTGGSGFIGSAVVAELLSRGIELINYDSKPPLRPEHRSFWRPGDLANVSAMTEVMRSLHANAVIHLAAKADISSSNWRDFASIHQGTDNLLAAIDVYGHIQRVANISTQLVIGPGYQPRSLLDYRPYTTYGEAKAYGEASFLQWKSPAKWFIVRPANIWGPQHPSAHEAIWKYIMSRAYMHPTGAAVLRTYGYVDNTAHQIVELLLAPTERTERSIFYVSDHVLDSLSWAEAFSLQLTGKPVRRVPMLPFKALGVMGDAAKRLGIASPIDSGRVLRLTESYAVPLAATLELTGPPPVSFEDGVTQTVAWLRSTGAPYR